MQQQQPQQQTPNSASLLDQEVRLVSDLTQALPKGFSFYHLGEVTIHEEILPASFDEMTAVGFSFQGEMRGLLVVLFDRDLDTSTYTEMGNILASRIATQLSRESGLEIMISVPHSITPPQLNKLIEQDTVIIHRTYMHQHAGKSIPVHTLLMPADSSAAGGAGHA